MEINKIDNDILELARKRKEQQASMQETGIPVEDAPLDEQVSQYAEKYNSDKLKSGPKVGESRTSSRAKINETTPEDTSSDEGFSALETISNIPSSAKDYAQTIVHPFLHPVDTYEAFKELGVEGSAKAIKDMYVERYGSVEKALNTIEKDPIGALADLSFVFSGPSAALAKVPGTVGKAGKAVNKAAMAVNPTNLAKSGVRLASKAIPDAAVKRLYESGAKFGTSLGKTKRDKLTQTALDNELTPTSKGIDRLTASINSIDSKIDSLIEQSTKTGQKVHSKILFKYIDDVKKDLGGIKIGAKKNQKQVADVVRELKEQIAESGSPYLSAKQLQALKRDAYKQVKYDSPIGAPQRGTEKATKAIAKSAKEGVELFADVGELNKQYGDLLELVKPLQSSAGRIANRNLLGISTPLNVGAGGIALGPKGAAIGIALSLIENPKLKTRAAVLLHKMQTRPMFEQSALQTITQDYLYMTGQQVQEQ